MNKYLFFILFGFFLILPLANSQTSNETIPPLEEEKLPEYQMPENPFVFSAVMSSLDNPNCEYTLLILNDTNLGNIADSFTNLNAPNTNYGNTDNILAGAHSGAIDERIWVKFNLSLIPDNVFNVYSSTFIDFCYYVDAPANPKISQIYNSSNSWGELTITWNNQPSVDELQDEDVTNCSNEFNFFDVVEATKEAIYDDYLLSLEQNILTNSNNMIAFRSKEHTNATQKPQLYICYDTCDSNYTLNYVTEPECYNSTTYYMISNYVDLACNRTSYNETDFTNCEEGLVCNEGLCSEELHTISYFCSGNYSVENYTIGSTISYYRILCQYGCYDDNFINYVEGRIPNGDLCNPSDLMIIIYIFAGIFGVLIIVGIIKKLW